MISDIYEMIIQISRSCNSFTIYYKCQNVNWPKCLDEWKSMKSFSINSHFIFQSLNIIHLRLPMRIFWYGVWTTILLYLKQSSMLEWERHTYGVLTYRNVSFISLSSYMAPTYPLLRGKRASHLRSLDVPWDV